MSAMAPQITSPTIVYPTVYSGTDQRNHQSSASPAFVRGIHRWPVNSPHKGPVKRIFFIFDDVIMMYQVWWEFILLNSLWPNDTIWEHRSGTTLVRVMVYSLTKFIHNALIKWKYLQPDICVSRLKACHPWWSWGESCIFCYIKPVKRLRKIYICIYRWYIYLYL